LSRVFIFQPGYSYTVHHKLTKLNHANTNKKSERERAREKEERERESKKPNFFLL